MVGQIVGYGRVSSASQNEARQVDALSGCDRLFIDKASGKSADRPELIAALEYLREGDTLQVPSMDRLARNLDDLRKIVRDLTDRGIQVHFVKESMTFTGEDNAMSTLLLSMLGAVAEFERALIKERQAEGIAIAKAKGVYQGRKPSLNAEQISIAKDRVEAGVPKAVVARDLGVSRQTLYNALAG